MAGYTKGHAKRGLDVKLPKIETWPSQFPAYEITIEAPEFTSVCPKTGLPDFGLLVLRYEPDRSCVELKSYKEYMHAYRSLGIFYENVVNRVLRDVVSACKPLKASLTGVFNSRGGLSATVVATYTKEGGFGT
jgi:7-cyano-7-deazaguanine reductase